MSAQIFISSTSAGNIFFMNKNMLRLRK